MKLHPFARLVDVRHETAWQRGLYRASDGRFMNADCNRSGNIIRKVTPDAFPEARAVEDEKTGDRHSLVIYPVRIDVPLTKLKDNRSMAKASGQ
jgi:hypothetical protein